MRVGFYQLDTTVSARCISTPDHIFLQQQGYQRTGHISPRQHQVKQTNCHPIQLHQFVDVDHTQVEQGLQEFLDEPETLTTVSELSPHPDTSSEYVVLSEADVCDNSDTLTEVSVTHVSDSSVMSVRESETETSSNFSDDEFLPPPTDFLDDLQQFIQQPISACTKHKVVKQQTAAIDSPSLHVAPAIEVLPFFPTAPPCTLEYKTVKQPKLITVAAPRASKPVAMATGLSSNDTLHADIHKMMDKLSAFQLGDGGLYPPPFSGKLDGEGVERWIDYFKRFKVYRKMDDTQALELLQMLLTGSAHDWLTTQPSSVTGNLKTLLAAFQQRFTFTPAQRQALVYKLFDRKQSSEESVDNYFTAMKHLAKRVDFKDMQLLQDIITRNFVPHICEFVMQNKPKDLNGVLEAARIAETSRAARRDDVSSNSTAGAMGEFTKEFTKTMTEVLKEIRAPRVATVEEEGEEPSAFPVYQQQQQTARTYGQGQRQQTYGRSDRGFNNRPASAQYNGQNNSRPPYNPRPTYQGRGPRTFGPRNQQQQQAQVQYPQQQQQPWRQTGAAYNRSVYGQQHAGGSFQSFSQRSTTDPQQQQPQSACRNCGLAHARGACFAVDKVCLYCQRIGHLARVCNTRRRHEQQGQGSGYQQQQQPAIQQQQQNASY
jgi:hypothetical protein